MTLGDLLQTLQEILGLVSADAPIADPGARGDLLPLAARDDAVAEEDDIVGPDRVGREEGQASAFDQGVSRPAVGPGGKGSRWF